MSLHESFYRQHSQRLAQQYPSCSQKIDADTLKHLISPYEVPLSRALYHKIEKAIAALYQIRSAPQFQQALRDKDQDILGHSTQQASVLMAYDFHIDSQQERAGLIEINTNASGYVLAQALYAESPLFPNALESLKNSFVAEMEADGPAPGRSVAIVDEAPEQQKMYGEFLIYKDLLARWGFAPQILDFEDIVAAADGSLQAPDGRKIDFIYNRWTDFLLTQPESQTLRQAYLKHTCVLSPHPKEYLLLAGKQRLTEFTQEGWLEKLSLPESVLNDVRQVLLKTYDSSHFGSPEELWQRRKSFFFKPKRSFGGKSTYRGTSITKKVFERVWQEGSLIQEYMPAAQIRPAGQIAVTEEPGTSQDWKFDLRFFVYRDQIQLAAARIYQGQVTNFNQPYGGFGRLKLV